MRYRQLGQTGLRVSEIGFGGWPIGGAVAKGYGKTDDAESLKVLQAAYDAGCTFFDTADVYGYGHSEMLIGQALKSWDRERVVIATKVGLDFSAVSENQDPRPVFSEKHIRSACEASLKRLGIDAIDVYQLQTPTLELVQHGQMFEVMKALKQEGKIKHYGISIHDPQEGIQAIAKGQVETVQVIVNLFHQRPLNTLFETCQKHNVAVIAREPFAQGLLSGSFDANRVFESNDVRAVFPKLLLQRRAAFADKFNDALPENYPALYALALQYALSFPDVSTVIPGCRTLAQTRQNFSAQGLPPLTEAQIQRIQEIQKTLS